MTTDGRRRLTWVLIAMTLANAMILVDQTAVPLTLPDVMRQYSVGSQKAQWMLNASLLPLAGLLVFGGRLGDLIGRRRVFIAGAVLFTGGSALAGLAPSITVLLSARVLQGIGGALMLPATVAIVSSAFPAERRGRALGTMGGAAAVFAALGPTIGGTLTSALSWRAVLLVNVPLAAATVALTLRHVPADEAAHARRAQVDAPGTALLSITLVGLVFGLSQSQQEGWGDVVVIASLVAAVGAAAGFVWHERRTAAPLVDFALLRHRNYLGASISQFLAGMAEIGLGVIFPLLLILNLGMDPVLAGLALIPTTVPMVVVAPLAGRWCDRAGGRPPLVTGFGLLALSGVVLALGVGSDSYPAILPGLLLYGVGLSLVLTVNDAVTLDSLPERVHGQASGVSATAEQFGGALGIAVLYSIFHATYVDQLEERVGRSALPDLTRASGEALQGTLQAAEATGLRAELYDERVRSYLRVAEEASNHGYQVTFMVVALIAATAAALMAWLVRSPTAARPAPPG